MPQVEIMHGVQIPIRTAHGTEGVRLHSCASHCQEHDLTVVENAKMREHHRCGGTEPTSSWDHGRRKRRHVDADVGRIAARTKLILVASVVNGAQLRRQ